MSLPDCSKLVSDPDRYNDCVLSLHGYPLQAIGLCFSDICIQKTPLEGEPGYQLPGSGTQPGFPAPNGYGFYAPLVDPIKTQAKVVFIASCEDGRLFEELWQIQDNVTVGKALIVPTNKLIDVYNYGYQGSGRLCSCLHRGRLCSKRSRRPILIVDRPLG
jgi:hypothetical protein